MRVGESVYMFLHAPPKRASAEVRFLLTKTYMEVGKPETEWLCCQVDAVGTVIADRPPHRTVRARLRIRLSLWMNGEEALHGIRMHDARDRNVTAEDRGEPIPWQHATLAAPTENQAPQPPQALPKDP